MYLVGFLKHCRCLYLKKNGKNNGFLLSEQYEIGEYTDLFFLHLELFFLVELRKWTVENVSKTMLKLLKRLLAYLIVAEI